LTPRMSACALDCQSHPHASRPAPIDLPFVVPAALRLIAHPTQARTRRVPSGQQGATCCERTVPRFQPSVFEACYGEGLSASVNTCCKHYVPPMHPNTAALAATSSQDVATARQRTLVPGRANGTHAKRTDSAKIQ